MVHDGNKVDYLAPGIHSPTELRGPEVRVLHSLAIIAGGVLQSPERRESTPLTWWGPIVPYVMVG